jgi:hypothetical protein
MPMARTPFKNPPPTELGGLMDVCTGLDLFAAGLDLFAAGLDLCAAGLDFCAAGLDFCAAGLDFFAVSAIYNYARQFFYPKPLNTISTSARSFNTTTLLCFRAPFVRDLRCRIRTR